LNYRPFLFEIGVEDLPPGFVKYGREHIEKTVPELLRKRRVNFDGISVYGTPRRLAFVIENCAERQCDSEVIATGPAMRIAYDAQGKPTKAAIGFARSVGVPVDALHSVETAKGEYVAARKMFVGRPTVEVMPELVETLVASFSFPKMMRWTNEGFAFGRPVRWLLALFGDELVKCSVFGIESSNVSRGIWTQGGKEMKITSAGKYVSEMEQGRITVSQECRIKAIQVGIQKIRDKFDCEVVFGEGTLSILADSIDSPRVTHGEYDPRFLKLPEPVLTTCLWHHQYFLATRPKFFSRPSGGFKTDNLFAKLLPRFVALLANPEADEETVRRGNEAVLEARLEDAAFFFAEDKKTPLEELLPRLQGMALHKGLGDLLMKSQRLAKLAPEIASLVFAGRDSVGGVPLDEFEALCSRSGELCKADLVTHMVGEFAELQGVMGGIYAGFQCEPIAVGAAIAEHYRPRGIDDEPPKTNCGRILALADKLDSLCAFFGAGHVPKGSQDPLGLRREAQGIVSILLDAEYRLSLLTALDKAIEKVEASGSIEPADDLGQQVLAFIRQRLSFSLISRESLRQDLVAAAISHPCDDVVDLRTRALALQELSKDEQFEALTTGLKRASNILRGEKWGELDTGLLAEEQEVRLFDEIRKIEDNVYQCVDSCKYLDAFRLIAGLRPHIDDFFDHVMVMVDDDKLKQNRLALLARLTRMFGSIADFSRIVVERK